jgi:hypothetical protein
MTVIILSLLLTASILLNIGLFLFAKDCLKTIDRKLSE